jgi:hypothetical protein
VSSIKRASTLGRFATGEDFLYSFKGARSAPRAVRRVIPREATWLAGGAAAGMLGSAGASARGTLSASGLAAPP